MLLRVRQVEKSTRIFKKKKRFLVNFPPKLYQKLSLKVRNFICMRKIMIFCFLAPLFGPGIDFWPICGPRPGPKTETFGIPVSFILFTFFAISPKRDCNAPRRPRGRPTGLPGTLQGISREPPGTILVVFFL